MPMLAALIVFAQIPTPVRLEQQGRDQVLHVGKAAYPLEVRPPMWLDGGELRPSGPDAPQTPPLGLGWYRGGQQLGWIDLAQLVGDWLAQDEVWGGHAAGNEMRYMASGGGGMYAVLVESHAQYDHTSLGTIAIREGGPSGEPIAAEFLVRFHANPLRLERIRRIETPGDKLRFFLRPKLFSYKGHLLLVTSDQVQELRLDGSVRRKWMDLPRNTVVEGLATGRWLVGQRSQESGNDLAFQSTDLTAKTTMTFMTYQGTNPPLIAAPSLLSRPRLDSPFLLFEQGRYDNQKPTRFTVHLPDGRKTPMPLEAMYLAGPFVVGQDTLRLSVVSANTGQPVK